MTSVTLYRASSLALLLGAVLFIIGGIPSFAYQYLTPLYFSMNMLREHQVGWSTFQ